MLKWDMFLAVVILFLSIVSYKYRSVVTNGDASNFLTVLGFCLSFLGLLISYISLRNVISIKRRVTEEVSIISLLGEIPNYTSKIDFFVKDIETSESIGRESRNKMRSLLYEIKETTQEIIGHKEQTKGKDTLKIIEELISVLNKENPEVDKLADKFIALRQKLCILQKNYYKG